MMVRVDGDHPNPAEIMVRLAPFIMCSDIGCRVWADLHRASSIMKKYLIAKKKHRYDTEGYQHAC